LGKASRYTPSNLIYYITQAANISNNARIPRQGDWKALNQILHDNFFADLDPIL